MLDYPSVAALAAVVRAGSFERAAVQLGVTPSAVSQRIKGLEERLGVPLVVRGAPCIATAAGARLTAHFDQVALLEYDLLSQAPSWVADADAPNPTLRIALNSDSLGTWFPAAAARFAVSHDATLDLRLDDETHTAERLRSGEVIAAVNTTGKTVQGCRTVPLGALRYVAVASPSYAKKYLAGGLTRDTLARAPILRFDARDDLQNRWSIKAVGAAVEAPTHWAPSTRGLLDLTLAGLGWSLTPEALAAPLLTSGQLVDLDKRVRLDVPLFWQHLRITARLLENLTSAVRAAAAERLVQPG